jgi:hypothetical protein
VSRQQFDEVRLQWSFDLFDNSYTPDTPDAFFGPLDFEAHADLIYLANSDSADHIAQIGWLNGGSIYPIGSVTVPAGRGFDGTTAIEALSLMLPINQTGIGVPKGQSLGWAASTAPSTGKLTLFVIGGTF